MAPHSALRWRWLAMAIIAVVEMLAVVSGATNAVVPTCRVVNATQGRHVAPDSGESLTTAIAEAVPGDELTVTGTCTGTYTLDKSLTLTGLATKKFPIPTLDGGHAGTTLTVDPAVTATVTNLALTGGTGQGDIERDAGGIYNRGTLTLIRANVIGNVANRGIGGGILNSASATLILQGFSVVSGNSAEHGGGIFNSGTGTVIIRESSIVSGNTASDFGGGIESFGTLTIDSSSVTGNNAQFYGGAISNGGSVVLRSAAVSNNTVTYDAAGIYNGGGTVTLESSTVSGNMGSGSGGGIYNRSGAVTVTSSTLSQNMSGNGGGIYNGTSNATLTLSSSVVSGNTGYANGGGIYNDAGIVNIQNSSTVTGNTAFFSGGGIYNSSGLVNLSSSLVSGNIPDNCIGVVGC
jgi:hypothetical protein